MFLERTLEITVGVKRMSPVDIKLLFGNLHNIIYRSASQHKYFFY